MIYVGNFVYQNVKSFSVLLEADSYDEASDKLSEYLLTSMEETIKDVKKVHLLSIIEISQDISECPVIFNHAKSLIGTPWNKYEASEGVSTYIEQRLDADPFVIRN